MTRVSENSSHGAIQFSLNRAKRKMEDLQMKGSTLKGITRPSDNPIANVEALTITSRVSDNKQYLKNSDYALMNLNITETSLDRLTEIVGKAKEIAIAQSSDFYDGEIRKNVSNEIRQLQKQAIAIANKRVGQKYIFGGFKSLETPFDKNGKYKGDNGHTSLEVAKDFFVPINLHGQEVFFTTGNTGNREAHPLEPFPEMQNSPQQKDPNYKPSPDALGEPKEIDNSRDLASVDNAAKGQNEADFHQRDNLFAQLDSLANGLENNDNVLVRSLLEKFDDTTSRLITLRTRVGSISNSIMDSKNNIESNNIDSQTRRSKLVDADVAELFSDITRQQSVLKQSYQSSQGLLNKTLLDFVR